MIFAQECKQKGLCPVCLNTGEKNDSSVDMFGFCKNCGHKNE